MQDNNGYQMDNYMVEKVPVPKIPEYEMKKYIELSNQIPSADIDLNRALHSKLNQLIHKLYDLNLDEIKLIKYILEK